MLEELTNQKPGRKKEGHSHPPPPLSFNQYPQYHWPLMTYLNKPNRHLLQTLFHFNHLAALDIDNHFLPFRNILSFSHNTLFWFPPVPLVALPLLFSFLLLQLLFRRQLYLGICLCPTSHSTHLSHISHFQRSPPSQVAPQSLNFSPYFVSSQYLLSR